MADSKQNRSSADDVANAGKDAPTDLKGKSQDKASSPDDTKKANERKGKRFQVTLVFRADDTGDMALYERIRRVSEGSTLSMEKVARTALKFGIEEARNRALAYYQAIKTAGEAFDADPDAQAARGGGQPPV